LVELLTVSEDHPLSAIRIALTPLATGLGGIGGALSYSAISQWIAHPSVEGETAMNKPLERGRSCRAIERREW
jgi:hypothetical protein